MLSQLDLQSNEITDLWPLSGMSGLDWLFINNNEITDISPLSGLTDLELLLLQDNEISEIWPLSQNAGLDEDDLVDLRHNPLDDDATSTYVPTLEGRGVRVAIGDEDHGDTHETATSLLIGGTQQGMIDTDYDVDVFSVVVWVGTDVVLYTSGDLETGIALYDADGNFLEASYDHISRHLETGIYYVEVYPREVYQASGLARELKRHHRIFVLADVV